MVYNFKIHHTVETLVGEIMVLLAIYFYFTSTFTFVTRKVPSSQIWYQTVLGTTLIIGRAQNILWFEWFGNIFIKTKHLQFSFSLNICMEDEGIIIINNVYCCIVVLTVILTVTRICSFILWHRVNNLIHYKV